MKVLVLGKSGMLGSALYSLLKREGLDVYGSQRDNEKKPYYVNVAEKYADIEYLKNIPADIDCVINCIGIRKLDRSVPLEFRESFYVNAFFPAYLQEFCLKKSIKVIHISTDAVFKGGETACTEDHVCDGQGDYAVSKILGEIIAPNVLNIRCSIIGNRFVRNDSLLDWFLSKKDGVIISGYTNHIWNGVTTLQLSEFMYNILKENTLSKLIKKTSIIHFSPNLPLSKYDLLVLFKEIYKKNINIIPVEAKERIVRILDSNFSSFYLPDNKNKKNIRGEILKLKNAHKGGK